MAGQLVQRGKNTWLVRIALGRDAAGKRLYHNHTVHGTKKDAQRYLTKTLRELDTSTFVEASQQSVADYLRERLDGALVQQVSARTLGDYRALVTRHLIPALGQRTLAQLSATEIQKIYTVMQQRGLSARTVRYVHSVLNSALEQAVRMRLLAANPAKLVTLPRQLRREMRALSQVEAKRLLAASAGTRFESLWSLLLTSGLRPGEALGLKWADISENRIRVQRALVCTPNGTLTLAEPKTPRARRVVTIPPTTMRALQAHRKTQLETRLRAGEGWQPLDLVFTTNTGTPLDWRVVARRHFRPLCEAAGLTGLRPYDLRHSCASFLLAAGENVKVVSERLGHASAALTLDVYSHVLPDMQQRASDRLESLLFG